METSLFFYINHNTIRGYKTKTTTALYVSKVHHKLSVVSSLNSASPRPEPSYLNPPELINHVITCTLSSVLAQSTKDIKQKLSYKSKLGYALTTVSSHTYTHNDTQLQFTCVLNYVYVGIGWHFMTVSVRGLFMWAITSQLLNSLYCMVRLPIQMSFCDEFLIQQK